MVGRPRPAWTCTAVLKDKRFETRKVSVPGIFVENSNLKNSGEPFGSLKPVTQVTVAANRGSDKPLPGLLAKQRISAMRDATIGLEPSEDEILTCQISDDVLEAAAGAARDKAAGLTLAYCTGLDTCPA
jgi:hypothetical protein